MRTAAIALLRDEMRRRGLTQAATAQVLGCSRATIIDYLSGAKRPNALRRAAIAIWSRERIPEAAWLTARERALLESATAAATGTDG